jgi:site-specific recombinase XerD
MLAGVSIERVDGTGRPSSAFGRARGPARAPRARMFDRSPYRTLAPHQLSNLPMTASDTENALVPASGPNRRGGRQSLEIAEEAVAEFIAASKADATRRAYASDWRDFAAWCAAHQQVQLPAAPATVAAYLGALATAGAKVSTVRRRCAAIGDAHRRGGHENPAAHAGVKATLAGIARTLGAPPAKKAALTADLLAKALRSMPRDLAGLRDRALILIGFAAALRRSELVALDVADLTRHPKGLVITIRRSKTDQAGAGCAKAVPHGRKLRAVQALDAWLGAAKISAGPVFRGVRGSKVLPARLCAHQVARIVQKRAAAAGLDPSLFAGHSLRSGYISSAAERGASLVSIAAHANHKKLDTTRGYVQIADAFRDHSGKGFL